MSDYATLSGTPKKILDADLNSWEGIGRESPWVIEREGVYHLLYAANYYADVDYGVGVAASASPMGPFTRDERNPLLATNLEKDFYGPGNISVATGAADDTLLFYHTKIDPEPDHRRLVRYGPLWFDENGSVQIEQP